MKDLKLPDIQNEDRTPLVDSLLVIIELLVERVRQQDEAIQLLKDEVRILKGEKKRPTFKPSQLNKKLTNPIKAPLKTKRILSEQIQTNALKMQN